jgi:MFS family permease
MAYGTSIALTPLHLHDIGYEKREIGRLAAFFASGIVLFSLPMGGLVRRFSAKRTLSVALLGYAIAVALFPFMKGFAAIALARFFDGAFSVGIWVSSETIVIARAEDHQKAYVTSLYALFMAVGYVVGPLVARVIVSFAPMYVGFLSAMGFALAAIIVVLTRLNVDVRTHGHDAHDSVATDDTPRMPMGEIVRRIRTSCFATFAYGYFQAAAVLFMPLYLIEARHVPEADTIQVTACFALGMLLCTNPAGRLGDAIGHLKVMRGLAVLGTIAVGVFPTLTSFPLICLTVFLAGACLASVSPVSLALQGIVIPPRELSRSNSVYNTFYAVGMLLGPPAASEIYHRFGGQIMLQHLAALWACFVFFTIVFAYDDPRARGETPALSVSRST